VLCLSFTHFDKMATSAHLLIDHIIPWTMVIAGLCFLFLAIRKSRLNDTWPPERCIILYQDNLIVYNHSIWSDTITVPYECITDIRKTRFFGNWNIAIKYLHRSLTIELAESNNKSVVDKLFEELCKRVPEKTKTINLQDWQFTLGQLFWITTLLALLLSLHKIDSRPISDYIPWAILVGFTVYYILWEHRLVIPKSHRLRAFLVGACFGILVECAGSLAWCAANEWSASWASDLAAIPYPLSIGLLEQIYICPTGTANFGCFLLPAIIGAYLASGVFFGIMAIAVCRMCRYRCD